MVSWILIIFSFKTQLHLFQKKIHVEVLKLAVFWGESRSGLMEMNDNGVYRLGFNTSRDFAQVFSKLIFKY